MSLSLFVLAWQGVARLIQTGGAVGRLLPSRKDDKGLSQGTGNGNGYMGWKKGCQGDS